MWHYQKPKLPSKLETTVAFFNYSIIQIIPPKLRIGKAFKIKLKILMSLKKFIQPETLIKLT